jgi:hypothetical protein
MTPAADSRPVMRRPGEGPPSLRERIAARPDPLVTLLLGAILAAVAFSTGGGGALDATTVPEIVLTLLGAVTVAVATVLAPPGQRLWGGITLALFAALAALTAISITWSIDPASSWNAANLLFAYLGTFAAAIALVRISPRRWAAVVGAVVLATVVVCGWSLLSKVFPALTDSDVGRLRAPFDYWNSVGLMAVLGMPGCLWLGTRRDGHAALRGLAIPALTLLLTAMILSFSRGAVIVTVLTLVLWVAIVPLRLRSAAALICAALPTIVLGVWAASNDSLTQDGLPDDVRVSAGHEFGLLLLTVSILALLAGLAYAFATSRAQMPPANRRNVGAVLLVLVALVPVAGIGKLATSDRGVGGSVSHVWSQLTDPNAIPPSNDPSRLTSAGSLRARYWDDALKIWRYARWSGVGADAYDTARAPIQADRLRAGHAHGYVFQTIADLGIVGIGVNALLLLSWLVAASRSTGLRPRRRYGAWLLAVLRSPTVRLPLERREPVPWTPERVGLVTLLLTAVAFGAHSAIDWTWFIPGNAVVGLFAAAWVAGRGPLVANAAEAATATATPRRRRSQIAAPTRLALATMVVLAGLVGAWTIWQPLRSQNADFAAYDAQASNHLQDARADAQHAIDLNPLWIDPRVTLAGIQESQGRADEAVATLEHTVALQPASSQAWLALGDLLIRQRDFSRGLGAFAAAVFLDPRNPAVQTELAKAQQAAQTAGAAPSTTSSTPPASTTAP